MRIDAYLEKVANFPFAGLDKLGPGGMIVLAPHPDDEALGAGGLIAACLDAGIGVTVVVLTNGAGSHPNSRSFPKQRLIALRQQECRHGLAELGLDANRIVYFGLEDAAAPTHGIAFDDAVQRLAALVRRTGSTSLLVTWDQDPHCDHLAAAKIAKAVGRTVKGLLVWYYPIWGWFLPAAKQLDRPSPAGFRFDITRWLDRKQRAIAAHASQMACLIEDDPRGFTFEPEKLKRFLRPVEYFIWSEP